MKQCVRFLVVIWVYFFTSVCVYAASESTPSGGNFLTSGKSFSYLELDIIFRNKQKVLASDVHYLAAFNAVIKQAEQALTQTANPVTNKPKAGPSGDLHDYVSIGPYWWPDPTKPDGLPWIRKDGEVNPLTRGDNTDQQRAKAFLNNLEALNLAYLYSENKKYLIKAKTLIDVWLIAPETKMNPHLDYAQGVPGASTGRPYGVIEWENIASVVTALELLKHTNTVNEHFIKQANLWLRAYLTWLLTSEIGMQEAATKNNHANWYDFQVLGLMLYLENPQAKAYAQALKSKRIDTQIQADGAQPHELARTKSVNYTSMNLMAFLKVAKLAEKLEINLLHYVGKNGQSIEAAAKYMVPYLQGEKKWQHKQLGGVKKAFESKAISSLYAAYKLFGSDVIPTDLIENNIQHVKPTIMLTF